MAFPDPYPDWSSPCGLVALQGAANIVLGTNPAYNAADFLSIYPKFGGNPLALTGTLTAGLQIVTAASTTGLAAGQPVLSANGAVPTGTMVQSVDSSTQFTISKPAAVAGAQSLAICTTLALPAIVLNSYIALASASVVQARWLDSWSYGMALFIAHYATLYLMSEADGYQSAKQVAQSGMQQGITVAASAGPVSESLQPVQGAETWGHWNMTTYGVQFAAMARMIGSGPMLIW